MKYAVIMIKQYSTTDGPEVTWHRAVEDCKEYIRLTANGRIWYILKLVESWE